MTSQEAEAGFRTLAQKFNTGYLGRDLNPIWAELLTYPVECFERALGICLKNCRRLPSADYVLEQTRYWTGMMYAEFEAEKSLDTGESGAEALKIIQGVIQGEITPGQASTRLYQLSEKYGNAEYAQAARRYERMKGVQDGE